MPDVRNLAIGATTVGANFEKFQINTSDAGRELIVKITMDDNGSPTTITTAGALAAYRQLTQAFGTGDGVAYWDPTASYPGDAGTFAAFGTADGKRVVDDGGDLKEQTIDIDGNLVTGAAIEEVFVRLQTTGFPNDDDIDMGDDVTVEMEQIAVFQAAK